MKSAIKFTRTITLFAVICFVLNACKKDEHKPPTISLKTGTGYTSDNATVAKNQAIKVGIVGDKVEDDMISLNASYAFDNAATTTTLQTISLTGSQQQHFDVDVSFNTRNQAGTEKYIFTITDADGNIAQKQIVLTVQ
jgi:hypothetical protein